MSGWHPVTKAALALGSIAIFYLLLTDGGGGGGAVVAPVQPQTGPPPADRVELPSFGGLGLLPPVETFNAIVERPLFVPSRRPYTAPEPVVVEETYEPAPDAPLEPGIVFIGTVRRGNQVLALVNREDGGGVDTLRIGATINGWQVLSIEDRALELGQAGERRSLAMFAPQDDAQGANADGGGAPGSDDTAMQGKPPPNDDTWWDQPDPDVDG